MPAGRLWCAGLWRSAFRVLGGCGWLLCGACLELLRRAVYVQALAGHLPLCTGATRALRGCARLRADVRRRLRLAGVALCSKHAHASMHAQTEPPLKGGACDSRGASAASGIKCVCVCMCVCRSHFGSSARLLNPPHPSGCPPGSCGGADIGGKGWFPVPRAPLPGPCCFPGSGAASSLRPRAPSRGPLASKYSVERTSAASPWDGVDEERWLLWAPLLSPPSPQRATLAAAGAVRAGTRPRLERRLLGPKPATPTSGSPGWRPCWRVA